MSFKEVTASRGKAQRAEPIGALFEQKRVKLVGSFQDLEDQLCSFTSAGNAGDGSPDRADALVWALTDLMLAPQHDGEYKIMPLWQFFKRPDEASEEWWENEFAARWLKGANLRVYLAAKRKQKV